MAFIIGKCSQYSVTAATMGAIGISGAMVLNVSTLDDAFKKTFFTF